MVNLRFHCRFTLILVSNVAAAALASPPPQKYFLQRPHPATTPSETLSKMADECSKLGVESFDVYGDFHVENKDDSFLRRFEVEAADDFGMEDAVFMPSGVMAQSIALLIHSQDRMRFACHHSSHLLLHEENGYRELLRMEPLEISTREKLMPYQYGIAPLKFDDVENAFECLKSDEDLTRAGDVLSTFILELPHRELGGKLTPWEDVLQMQKLCTKEGIKFHCDGARIFEASAGYELNLSELVKPFDSVYISFYKGLGGISGAMLLGSNSFCAEARKWLRRFGGNLYTLMPYAVSGWSGYKKHVKGDGRACTFEEKQKKLSHLTANLSKMEDVANVVAFDPPSPETNMVHGVLRASAEECLAASSKIEEQCGISVLNRVRNIDETDPAFELGFRSKFELSIGDSNFAIDNEIFFSGWKDLGAALSSGKEESR